MKQQTRIALPALASSLLLLALGAGVHAQQKKDPVDYVNPNIGGIGQLLQPTQPAVQYPYGAMRIVPLTTPGITDRYLADDIYGFPAGGVVLMPQSGAPQTVPAQYAAKYEHDLETATPYYYAVTLENNEREMHVEYTVSQHAAFYRILFPADAPAHLLMAVRGAGEIRQDGPAVISGREPGEGAAYFYAEFSKPFTGANAVDGVGLAPERRQPGAAGKGLMVDVSASRGEPVLLRLGTSYISVDQARQNLREEIADWDFDRVKEQARAVWNRELRKIEVKGGTEDERTIFYTALYRTVSRMNDITEDGRYYSAYDHQVHSAGGHHFYTNDGLWDTYRSAHPLQLLLDPDRQQDMVRSYLLMYDQSGWLPTFPSLRGGQRGMIGHHTLALIADTYMKGYRDFDVAKAYTAMKKMAMESTMLTRRSGPLTPLDRVYLEKGFFPALAKGEQESVSEVDRFERRQAVSVTLENAYDDWCLAQMAKALDHPDDYQYFLKRAHNYQNVWDARVGFMAPKSADGQWVLTPAEFSPIWSGGEGGRNYYTEMNAWAYTFHVQQDVAGLIDLMGGNANFVAKVDRLFTEQYRGNPPDGGPGGAKYYFQGWFPDMTGLVGQYSQGNEPTMHIPYLYDYAGQPWKTQRKVRELMKIWYNAGPFGIPGDEDGGAVSSWYAFSAMGFYPVCPGQPSYEIGSPLFEESRITLAGGKVFTITARNVSAVNKYIQSAQFNGKPWNKPWFAHSDMAAGGSLVLEMGPRPNTAWGSAPDAAPPSMSH